MLDRKWCVFGPWGVVACVARALCEILPPPPTPPPPPPQPTLALLLLRAARGALNRSPAPGRGSCSRVAAMGKSNRLPDGWIDYVPVGQRLHGTRFIAFKVPLKRIFDTKLSPAQRFSPMDLIRNIKAQKEELGLIIDLTCTTRYYEPEELPKTLRYSKIFTVGQEIPDSKTIRRFKSVVMQFLSENADNDKLIGVHCTHGLNRTGYLICRYLIDEQGMDPDEAIELFNGSRGHSIERQNYILDLQGKPVTNAHDRDTAGPVLHRAQKYISNGKPSHRADYDWNHPHHAPRFPSPWQHHRPQRFPSPWQHHGPQRPQLPRPGVFYDHQFNYGFPPPQHPPGPRQDHNWRYCPWEQSDLRDTHFMASCRRDVPMDHTKKRSLAPRAHVASAKLQSVPSAPRPQAAPLNRTGPPKKMQKMK